LLTAGIDAGPVGQSEVELSLTDERCDVVVGAVAERDVETGVVVVAGLVGEVELRELDARDVAEADGQRCTRLTGIGTRLAAGRRGLRRRG
jgi:hypothetical protein